MTGLNIYFCGSIRGGRQDAKYYLTIVEHLKTYGTVLNEIVADQTLTEEDRIPPQGESFIHDRDLEWFGQADVVVAEVTQVSLGVGYEMAMCVQTKKKTLALFRPDNARGRKLSAMIRGAPSNNGAFTVKDYNEDNVISLIDEFVKPVVAEKKGY